MNIAEIRQKYPQYANVSDDQLARGLHAKYYANMPFNDFAQRIGYQSRDSKIDELKRSNPGEYDPESKAFKEKYGATSGMGVGERMAANVGAGMTDIGLGIKQIFGGASGADAREKAARDKDLAKSIFGGKALQIGGSVAATLPAMAIPGVNTTLGAALLGAGTGALMPTQSDNVLGGKALNAGLGAATGGLTQKYLPPVIQKVGKAVKQVPVALAKRGLLPQGKAAPILQKEAEKIFGQNVDDPVAALAKIRRFRDVPGVEPTTAQILGDTKSLMVERQLRESGGEAAQTLSAMRTASNKARYDYLTDELDKDPNKLWEVARQFAEKSKGKMRVAKDGIDPNGTVIREIGRLRNSYDNARAKATLQELQDRVKSALAKQGTDQLESLHQVRMYEIDDALDRLKGTDTKLAKSLSAAFTQVKKVLDKRIGEGLKNNDAWTDFLTGYSERARKASEAQAGADLLQRINQLTPMADNFSTPALTSGRKLIRSAADAVDDFGNPLYSPLAKDALETVDRSLNTEMATLAPNIRPMGSATAANLNQPTVQALKALQPVIKGAQQAQANPSAAGAITGAATVLGGPAGGAAAALGGMGTQKIAGMFQSRSDQAALALARNLFEIYRNPQTAVQVLQQLSQRGAIPVPLATRAAQAVQYIAGPTGGQVGTGMSNRLLAPAQ